MTTIQFTFNKASNQYAYGFWVNGVFILRGQSADRDIVWELFCDDLAQLEESRKT